MSNLFLNIEVKINFYLLCSLKVNIHTTHLLGIALNITSFLIFRDFKEIVETFQVDMHAHSGTETLSLPSHTARKENGDRANMYRGVSG